MPHVNKKPLARKRIFVQIPFITHQKPLNKQLKTIKSNLLKYD